MTIKYQIIFYILLYVPIGYVFNYELFKNYELL